MTSLDELVSLALFARVVHHRSISAAAREAGLAKSAVSRRVAQLEQRLGVRLLQRSTRRLSATEEGLRLYEHCAALVSAADAASSSLGETGAVHGTVRLDAPVTFAQTYLMPALAGFLRRYPDVEVRLSTEDRLVDPIAGGSDVALRIGRLGDSGLVARRLASDRLVVCGSPAYLALRGEPRSPADLVHHECLHYGLVSRGDEWRFRGVSVPARGRFTATNGTVLAQAAIEGMGLAVLPWFMAARDVAAGRLRLVLEGARRAEIGVYAVTPHRTGLPARTRALIDHLARHFARPGWQTAGALSSP